MSGSEPEWHLVTVTGTGVVSILKNLKIEEARKIYQKLQPDTRPRKYVGEPKPLPSGSMMFFDSTCYMRSPSEINQIHAIGPENMKFEPWYGIEPLIIDRATGYEYRPPKPPEPSLDLEYFTK